MHPGPTSTPQTARARYARRVLCVMLVAVLAVAGLPAAAVEALEADGGTEGFVSADGGSIDFDRDILADSDELAAGWIEQNFYGDDATTDAAASSSSSGSLSTMASYGAGIFEGDAADLYGIFCDHAASIADTGGETLLGVTWTYDGEGDSASEVFEEGFEGFRFADVFNALLADCPYELYWFDKTIGVSYWFDGGGYSYADNGDGTFSIEATIYFIFAVSEDYANLDYSLSLYGTTLYYYVDTDLATSAHVAAANAQQIVLDYASETDVTDKLTAYEEVICGLVEYDSAAVSTSSVVYGDPWQIVSVFDGDDSTNVVCEGYAKAFQYLCDLTWPDNSPIQCWTVTGYLGSEAHMFNLVAQTEADDEGNVTGGSFLVDLTNSDEDTAGEAGGLFLSTPASGSGTTDDPFVFDAVSDGGTVTSVKYSYDDETTSLYDESILAFASSQTDFPTLTCDAGVDISVADLEVDDSACVYNNGEEQVPGVTLTFAGEELEEADAGETDGDYTISCTDNTSAGTATLVVEAVEGLSWRSSVTSEFTVARAEQDVSFSGDAWEVHVNAGTFDAPYTLSGALGTVTWTISDTDVATIDSSTGAVTVVSSGEATVTATSAGTVNYKSAKATYALTVTDHEYAEGTGVVTEPTCTEGGWTTYVCTVTGCGESFTSDATDATGHTLVKTEAVAATYTQEGTEAYWTCSVCGLLFSDEEATTQIASPVTTDKLSKKTNTLSVAAKKLIVKKATRHGKLRRNLRFSRGKVFVMSGGEGSVVFKKGRAAGGKIVLSKKGRLTLKKGLKKGTYKVKVTVSASGSTSVESTTVTTKLTVRLK